MTEPEPTESESDEIAELEDLVCARVREWLRRKRDEFTSHHVEVAKLTITLNEDGGLGYTDDDELVLKAHFREEAQLWEVEGVVTKGTGDP